MSGANAKTISLNREVYDRISAASAEFGMSRAQLVRLALAGRPWSDNVRKPTKAGRARK